MGATSSSELRNITYYADEIEPPIEFTGNKSGRNFAIICMNAFNLIMSLVVLNMHNNVPVDYVTGENIITDLIYGGFGFWLGWFPLLVSISYFTIPLLRFPSFLMKKKNRDNRVLHKILIGNICKSRKKSFTLSELIDFAKTKMNVDEDKIKNMMFEILRELSGSMEIKEDGTILYTFERLYDEFGLRV
jgi:uncharacterized membrane-anchored protein YitT (DUF2179 family)